MLRRQTLGFDDWARPEYASFVVSNRTPRKWTTVNARNVYPEHSYTPGSRYRVTPNDPAYRYVGKILIPWNGESMWGYATQLQSIREAAWRDPANDYVHEFDVARACRGNIYRILYVRKSTEDGSLYVISKPSQELQPARLNLYVDAKTNRIVAAAYF